MKLAGTFFFPHVFFQHKYFLFCQQYARSWYQMQSEEWHGLVFVFLMLSGYKINLIFSLCMFEFGLKGPHVDIIVMLLLEVSSFFPHEVIDETLLPIIQNKTCLLRYKNSLFKISSYSEV